MDISNHLSTLVKFNECVIIPDFGGFISNYVPSKFDPSRNIFTPPSKEIVFNSKINKNDGLLINHLVETEAIGYTEAHSAITNWVNISFEKLNQGETIEIPGIGTLAFDRYGSFVFHSTGENFLADAYGMEEVSYSKLTRPVYTDKYEPRPAVRAINHRKNVIRIAAGIALLVSLSIIPVKKETTKFLSSNLNPFASITPTTQPVQTVTKEAEPVNREEITSTESKPVVKESPYVLVGGSFGVLDNAKTFRDKLLSEGNHPELYQMKNGLYKVTIDSYSTKEEALEAMETYRSSHPGSQAWVSIR